MWRRRRCQNCDKVFTTRESVDTAELLRVTASESGKAQKYSRAKLLLSVLQACDHLANLDDAYWLCDTIEQQLLLKAASTGVVTKNHIVEATLATLKRFNTPAFIKYLSYHSPHTDTRSIKRQLRG